MVHNQSLKSNPSPSWLQGFLRVLCHINGWKRIQVQRGGEKGAAERSKGEKNSKKRGEKERERKRKNAENFWGRTWARVDRLAHLVIKIWSQFCPFGCFLYICTIYVHQWTILIQIIFGKDAYKSLESGPKFIAPSILKWVSRSCQLHFPAPEFVFLPSLLYIFIKGNSFCSLPSRTSLNPFKSIKNLVASVLVLFSFDVHFLV